MDKYFYPIPKERLLARFKPVFEQLSKTRNATLLALPFAGRSSHLRFIASQPEIQAILGIPNTEKVIWSETENYSDLGQLISQICVGVDPTSVNHPSIFSRDTFLIQMHLKSIIKSKGQLIIIISLGRLNQQLASDIEQLFTLLQKECSNLKILWSIDTVVYRNYLPKHASCNILESIFYFPTFDQDETKHSLKRIALTRQETITKNQEDEGFKQTGGLAGLFHLYLFQGSQSDEIMKVVQKELTLSPELSTHLTTPEFRQLLADELNSTFSYKNLNLNRLPTAQEITILNLLLEKENKYLTRDEIAQAIWGKLWREKYSDWAIDKSISRLRSILVSKTHQLITVKGLGYTLICTRN